ncbi:hypothetical protein MOSE0_L01948 [Monosporozyma servazzii]
MFDTNSPVIFAAASIGAIALVEASRIVEKKHKSHNLSYMIIGLMVVYVVGYTAAKFGFNFNRELLLSIMHTGCFSALVLVFIMGEKIVLRLNDREGDEVASTNSQEVASTNSQEV